MLRKGVGMVEGHLAPDHVHMLVSIPPKISVPGFMGCLKGKSALLMSGKACEPQVQVREQEVLDGRLLPARRRHERGHDREVHQGAGSCGHRPRQAQRQGVRGPVQQEIAWHSPSGGLATSQAAIGPERSEGQGLKSLAGIYRVMPSEQTTRYAGGHDFVLRASNCVSKMTLAL
jgi:hypothetical protein